MSIYFTCKELCVDFDVQYHRDTLVDFYDNLAKFVFLVPVGKTTVVECCKINKSLLSLFCYHYGHIVCE